MITLQDSAGKTSDPRGSEPISRTITAIVDFCRRFKWIVVALAIARDRRIRPLRRDAFQHQHQHQRLHLGETALAAESDRHGQGVSRTRGSDRHRHRCQNAGTRRGRDGAPDRTAENAARSLFLRPAPRRRAFLQQERSFVPARGRSSEHGRRALQGAALPVRARFRSEPARRHRRVLLHQPRGSRQGRQLRRFRPAARRAQ